MKGIKVKNIMSKRFSIIVLGTVILMSISCQKHEDVFFDTPFVTISDENRVSSSQEISSTANNLLSNLMVDLSISDNKFTEDITIEYNLIIGDGLQQDVDFTIQKTTASPLEFKKGTRSMPIRILWLKHDIDPNKDNTLTIELKSSSHPDMIIGYPGPSQKRSTFKFKKY